MANPDRNGCMPQEACPYCGEVEDYDPITLHCDACGYNGRLDTEEPPKSEKARRILALLRGPTKR